MLFRSPGRCEARPRLPATLLLIHAYGDSLGSFDNLDKFYGDGLHIHHFQRFDLERQAMEMSNTYTIPALDLDLQLAIHASLALLLTPSTVKNSPSSISSGGGNSEQQLPHMMMNQNKRRNMHIYGCTSTYVAYSHTSTCGPI